MKVVALLVLLVRCFPGLKFTNIDFTIIYLNDYFYYAYCTHNTYRNWALVFLRRKTPWKPVTTRRTASAVCIGFPRRMNSGLKSCDHAFVKFFFVNFSYSWLKHLCRQFFAYLTINLGFQIDRKKGVIFLHTSGQV